MPLHELANRFSKHVRVFGPQYAFIEMLSVVDRPISLKIGKPFSHKLLSYKEKYIMKWARKFFAEEIHSFSQKDPAKPNGHSESSPIWVCWLQGEDEAPSFVKQMVERVRKFAGTHPVYFIDKDNYCDFCTLAESFVDKYKKGQMPQQQFADAMRSALLCQRGGLWIDASIFVTRRIPEEVFGLPIYNVKGIKPNATRDAVACDSTGWEAYFIASQPQSVTYSFIYACFMKYWEHYDTLIDYFLFSYLAKIAREDLPGGAAEYAQVPNNNLMCEQLGDYLMTAPPVNAEKFNELMNGDTFIYKLTWKGKYPFKDDEGNSTLSALLFGNSLEER